MGRRTERIAMQLQSEISRVLRESVTDPRVGLVTVTRVDPAPDLSHALVYWSALDTDGAPVEEIQAGLESAASFVRHSLAQVLPLRRTPALRFRHDPSIAQGGDTLALLRELRDDETA